MNEWCLSCSCTFSTGCKRAAREAAPKRNHYSTPEQRREQYKRYVARHPRNEYFKARYEAKKRQSRQTLTTGDVVG